MTKAPRKNAEQRLLLDQIKHVAQGIGATFAPFCEVVVHDLLDPKHSIHAIHNNLSGRSLGGPTTELGLARLQNPEHPQVMDNYANRFPDGRQAKSTSIGVKDSSGRYVAAICLNIDLTLFRGLQNVLSQFSTPNSDVVVKETLDPANSEAIRTRIDRFAAGLSTTARALKTSDRRALIHELKNGGFLEVRKAMDTISQHLGVSRATVYIDAKSVP